MKISRRSRNRTEDKRLGHKKARQATRRVLENDHVEGRVDSMHYSTRVEQPPVPDAPVGPPKPKKSGCKRNKYGPHIIESWTRKASLVPRYDPDLKRIVLEPMPYWQRPYHPPYRCQKCGKGFYKQPKRNAIPAPSRASGVSYSNYENEKQDEHFDLWNIRARLLGIDCRCNDCNPVLS